MTKNVFHKSMIKNNLNGTWVRREVVLAGIARASQVLPGSQWGLAISREYGIRRESRCGDTGRVRTRFSWSGMAKLAWQKRNAPCGDIGGFSRYLRSF